MHEDLLRKKAVPASLNLRILFYKLNFLMKKLKETLTIYILESVTFIIQGGV